MKEERAITTLAEALALIRGLEQRLEKQARRLEKLQAEVGALKEENAALREENAALKAKLLPDPATPSGAVPVYEKPPGKRRGKKRGRPAGHPGERRKVPATIDRTEEHALECCTECGSLRLKRRRRVKRRVVEDAPEVKPEAVEHVTPVYECLDCGAVVSAPLVAALPGMQIGLHLLVLTAWLHYGLGLTAGNVVKYLNSLLQVKISAGGLTQMWTRLALWLQPAYEGIREEARAAPVLNADETGWRVGGRTWWLWCFAAANAVLYVLRPTRGARVVAEALGELFEGVLVCDFYGAYNALTAWAKQRCIVHLKRELKKVSLRNENENWKHFRRRLKRLLTEALNWKRHESEMIPLDYEFGALRFHGRLEELLLQEWTDKDARRLVKRLWRHREEVLTFLDTAANGTAIPADNNGGEREIRPAVVMRKNSYGNASPQGAATQEVLMSVFRTLHKRGEDPVAWVKRYLVERLEQGARPEKLQKAA